MALEILSEHLDKKEISRLIDRTDKTYPILKIGLLDELHYQVFGYAKIGSVVGKDRLSRDVYAFTCKKHGLQVTLPSGWSNKLLCNHCLLELKTEFEETHIKTDDKEKLKDKANKIKTDLSKYRSNKQNSK